MPSPRPVLDDIVRLGLDMSKHHSDTGDTGRLRKKEKATPVSPKDTEQEQVDIFVESATPQDPPQETLPEVIPAPPPVDPEPEKTVETDPVEPAVVEEPVVESVEKKKGRGFKKKKD